MGKGKVVFSQFIRKLMNICNNAFFQNEDIATIASYFWDSLDLKYKIEWKEYARCENIVNNFMGKQKKSGFWLFANKLINALYTEDSSFFMDIWNFLIPEERSLWEILSDDEIGDWIEKQVFIVFGHKKV